MLREAHATAALAASAANGDGHSAAVGARDAVGDRGTARFAWRSELMLEAEVAEALRAGAAAGAAVGARSVPSNAEAEDVEDESERIEDSWVKGGDS